MSHTEWTPHPPIKEHTLSTAAYNAAYYAEHREKIVAAQATYRAENRAKNAARAAAWRATNPAYIAAYNAAYNAAYPEKRLGYQAAYRDKHPEKNAAYQAANPEKFRAACARRRAKKRGNSIGFPLPDFKVILAEHGLICPLCEDDHTPIDLSAKWPAPNSLTWEHILAIDAGGPHATENIVPAHARCNLIKGKKILTPELREYIKARKKELDSADARKRLVST